MEIDPITLCLGCFPPVGRRGREGEREWKIDRGKTRRKGAGNGDGGWVGNRNGGANQKQKWRKGNEGERRTRKVREMRNWRQSSRKGRETKSM